MKKKRIACFIAAALALLLLFPSSASAIVFTVKLVDSRSVELAPFTVEYEFSQSEFDFSDAQKLELYTSVQYGERVTWILRRNRMLGDYEYDFNLSLSENLLAAYPNDAPGLLVLPGTEPPQFGVVLAALPKEPTKPYTPPSRPSVPQYRNCGFYDDGWATAPWGFPPAVAEQLGWGGANENGLPPGFCYFAPIQ
jgi:hypothetical protein